MATFFFLYPDGVIVISTSRG